MPKPLWAPWRLEYIEHVDEERGCIFCEPQDELVVHRGADAFVVLNRFPYASGHMLVAPFRHVADIGDLRDEEALEIHRLASAAVGSLSQAYRAQGYNLGWNLGRIAGAGIADHVHLHVVPRWAGDTNFMPVLADVKVLPQALVEAAHTLRAVWPTG